MEGTAGIVRLTHVHGADTGDIFHARAHFEKHLIAVLEDVCLVVKGNDTRRSHTDSKKTTTNITWEIEDNSSRLKNVKLDSGLWFWLVGPVNYTSQYNVDYCLSTQIFPMALFKKYLNRFVSHICQFNIINSIQT